MTKAVAQAPSAASMSDYPLAGTRAQKMIADALEKVQADKGQSQRYLAKILGYKSSVVLSHMASGRAPIPVDRAGDFARLLDLDPGEFLIAVMEQRHPDIDFRRLLGLGKRKKSSGAATASESSALAEELESIAGESLDQLPMTQVKIMREVVADNNAARRWIEPHEITMVESVRRAHPQGLAPAQMKKLTEFVEAL
jgi:hypothetical protein